MELLSGRERSTEERGMAKGASQGEKKINTGSDRDKTGEKKSIEEKLGKVEARTVGREKYRLSVGNQKEVSIRGEAKMGGRKP